MKFEIKRPWRSFGQSQSGFFQYKIANISPRWEIIREARESAFKIVSRDPSLRSCIIEI